MCVLDTLPAIDVKRIFANMNNFIPYKYASFEVYLIIRLKIFKKEERKSNSRTKESGNLPLWVKTGDTARGVLDNSSNPPGIKDNFRRRYAILGKGEGGQEFNFSCFRPD